MVFYYAKQGNLLINLGHKLHTHSVCLERVSAHTDLHSQSIAQQKAKRLVAQALSPVTCSGLLMAWKA